MFDTVTPNWVRMLYWDTKVCSDEKYEQHELDDFVKSTKPKGGGGGSCQVRLSTGGLLADVIMHTETQRERALKLSLGQKLRVKLRNVDIRGGRVMAMNRKDAAGQWYTVPREVSLETTFRAMAAETMASSDAFRR